MYYYRIDDENIQMSPLMAKAFIARMSKDKPAHLTELETKILKYISADGEVDLRSIAKNLHLSTSVVEKAVVKLFSIGSVEFVHHNDTWNIISTV